MSDESGIEPRATSAADYATLSLRVGTLETEVTALQTSAPVPQSYSCPSGATVRQLVYQSGTGAADLADASNVAKMPAIGFIASKPTSTSCVLQDEDELAGFSGLTVGAVYYADPATPGGITATKPDAGAGQYVQEVGVAKTASVLRVTISTPAPVIP